MFFSPRFLVIVFVYIASACLFLNVLDWNKKKLKMNRKKWWLAIAAVVCGFLILFGIRSYDSSPHVNSQCLGTHKTALKQVTNPTTPVDYLAQGDYEFETGNCQQAVRDYDKAISLDNGFAEAYNNRAYTYMMLTKYDLALPDLDKAIKIRPDYVHALMNRGDIYNYYYRIDRSKAIADYDKVIAQGIGADKTVCGHKFLAKHGGWTLGALLQFPFFLINPSCN